ncbi:MAG: hypothetical protein K8S99_17205 [Planctomycetes bacterium]|nr:hypothetical protein [Planctomycetota bacterium]
MATTPKTNPPVSDGPRPPGVVFAWAGWMLRVPDSWRLVRVLGDAANGAIVFAEDQRVSLRLQWSQTPRRPGDPAGVAAKRLVKLRLAPRSPSPAFETVAIPRLGPALLHTPDQPEMIYAFARSPHGREIELLYNRGQPREDEQFRRTVLPSLEDQPADAPQRWAVYDTSFTVPAGFRCHKSTLGLGDCRVQFLTGARELSGDQLTIRQVYPASLALTRQPLEKWHRDWIETITHNYLVPHTRRFGKGDPVAEPIDTPRGPALTTPGRLKFPLGLLYRSAAHDARVWMIHDTGVDRLIGVQLAVPSDRTEDYFRQVLEGLHWCQPHGA